MRIPDQLKALAEICIMINKIQLIPYDKELLRKIQLLLGRQQFLECEQLIEKITEESLQILMRRIMKHNFIPQSLQTICYHLYKDNQHIIDYSFLALPIKRLTGDELLHFVKYFQIPLKNYVKYHHQGLRVITDQSQLIISSSMEYCGIYQRKNIEKMLQILPYLEFEHPKGVARRTFQILFNNTEDLRSGSNRTSINREKVNQQKQLEESQRVKELQDSLVPTAPPTTDYHNIFRPVDEVVDQLAISNYSPSQLKLLFKLTDPNFNPTLALQPGKHMTGSGAGGSVFQSLFTNQRPDVRLSDYPDLPNFQKPITTKCIDELKHDQMGAESAVLHAVQSRYQEAVDKFIQYSTLVDNYDINDPLYSLSSSSQGASNSLQSSHLNYQGSQILAFVENCFE